MAARRLHMKRCRRCGHILRWTRRRHWPWCPNRQCRSRAGGYFDDLPPILRCRAEAWFGQFCARWRGNLPPWRLGILAGQARRLALMSDEERSAWGRSMLAKRGGYAVQHKYRTEGRHPTAKATFVRVWKQKGEKRMKAEAERRRTLGLPPPARVKFGPFA